MLRIVITGGPGVGKSSVIDALWKRGYSVIGESARKVIAKNPGSTVKSLVDIQKKIAQEQLSAENDILEGIVFCDRGLIDGFAYAGLRGEETPSEIETHGRERYHAVFVLEMLPEYASDEVRIEDEEEARLIHELVREAYEQFGYAVIHVPFLSVHERVEFILKHIGEKV